MEFYIHGINVGGKLCSTLEQFGYAIMIPIILNMFFGIWHWYKDVRTGEALYLELLFPLVSLYPQYKIMKL